MTNRESCQPPRKHAAGQSQDEECLGPDRFGCRRPLRCTVSRREGKASARGGYRPPGLRRACRRPAANISRQRPTRTEGRCVSKAACQLSASSGKSRLACPNSNPIASAGAESRLPPNESPQAPAARLARVDGRRGRRRRSALGVELAAAMPPEEPASSGPATKIAMPVDLTSRRQR